MTRPPKPPTPRVRRVLDVEPLPESSSPLWVRPFEECFDRGSSMSVLMLRGEIDAGVFRVLINGRSAVCLRGATAEDREGPFALLEPQEHALDGHHALRVEADAQDADGSYAAISYVELARDAVASRELAYAERWCSVYFNPRGVVDGSSWGGPRSVRPRSRN